MKAGSRALGLATSYAPGADHATVAGVVVRADRVVDGIEFGELTVGGTDSTIRLCELADRLDRPDVQYVFVAGIAPAQYNIIALAKLHDHLNRPVIAVAFDSSEGLSSSIRQALSGVTRDTALERYRALPERWSLSINDDRRYVRAVGCERPAADRIVREFTPEGGRPEPLRVARLVARSADQYRRNKTL